MPLKGQTHLPSYRRGESARGRRGGGSHLSSYRRMPRAFRGLPASRIFYFLGSRTGTQLCCADSCLGL